MRRWITVLILASILAAAYLNVTQHMTENASGKRDGLHPRSNMAQHMESMQQILEGVVV